MGEKGGAESPVVKVTFTNGDVSYVKRDTIIYALQQIHTSIGHAMGHIVYKSAIRWFKCHGLLNLCKVACSTCVCKLVKPNVGKASELGSFERPPCANYSVHIDTYDTEVPAIWNGRKVRYIQVRVDPFNNRIGATILKDKSAPEAWEAFHRDHVKIYGKPNTVHIDTGNEFRGEFTINLMREGIAQTLRAVARGQSNAKAERVQGEIGPALYAEIKERGMNNKEWPKVLSLVIDKLNRRPNMQGGPSAYENVNGSPPYFSAIDFLHSFSKTHKVKLPVQKYKIGEKVKFYTTI